ncbi:Alpha/Beta hydrolase protein, partial [Suillus occidentalis]
SAYTGYVDIKARYLFFYFFGSRNDDVIFCTSGGESPNFGVYMERPCRIIDDNGVSHPESWNANSNIFCVDQLIGTGFSHAEYGEVVDIAAFIAIFFENFTQFKGGTLHMTSESHGWRCIPAFAAEIYEQNAMLTAADITPIKLESIMIGNGLTDFYTIWRPV